MDLEETHKEGENTEGKITRAAAAKLAKKAFLEALKSNDFETLEELLSQKKIDVDTVFEVEDENLILASYKQGKCGSIHQPGSRQVWVIFQETVVFYLFWSCSVSWFIGSNASVGMYGRSHRSRGAYQLYPPGLVEGRPETSLSLRAAEAAAAASGESRKRGPLPFPRRELGCKAQNRHMQAKCGIYLSCMHPVTYADHLET